jgi:hypothetical protein
LVKQAADVERQIAAIQGVDTGPAAAPAEPGKKVRKKRKAKGRKRSRGPSLAQCCLDVLARSKKPLHTKELAERVLAAGYQSKSKSLPAQIYSQIYKDDRFVRVGPGQFTLEG